MDNPVAAVAEIQLERRRAVRALMATGADRATAEAAVTEQWRHAVSDPRTLMEANMAVTVDAWEEMARHVREVVVPELSGALRQMRSALARVGPAMRSVHGLPRPPGHPETTDDRWAAVIELKRAGAGSGPPARRFDRR